MTGDDALIVCVLPGHATQMVHRRPRASSFRQRWSVTAKYGTGCVQEYRVNVVHAFSRRSSLGHRSTSNSWW